MSAPQGRSESFTLYALAGALLLGGPVWRYLYVNHYPFSRPEAILLPLAAALLGAAIAAAGHRVGGLGEALSFGALWFGFVDLQLDLDRWIPTIVIAAGCVALPALLRSRRALLTCLMLAAFDLSSLQRPPLGFGTLDLASRGAARGIPAPPLLLHVVLDEQWGIGGVRAAGDTGTAIFLRDFYQDRGFEVYEGAYSRSDVTWEAIPEMLSLGRPAVNAVPSFADGSDRDWFRLPVNPYFERLRDLGYSIRVFQTTFLDYCHAAGIVVTSCQTMPANSIASIGHLGGPWTRRAILAGRYFLNMSSHVYLRLKRPPDSPTWRRSNTGYGLAELALVRDAIAAHPQPGTAFFVHVLVPHRPFKVDANCRTLEDLDQAAQVEASKHLSDRSWRTELELYGAQDRCVHRAVNSLLATLDRTVGRDRAIVIIHGDHGSRINQNPLGEAATSELDARQLNSEFSTLLAIRRPRVPAAIYAEAVPIQDFLWALVGRNFQGRISEDWTTMVRAAQPKSRQESGGSPRALDGSDILWAPKTP